MKKEEGQAYVQGRMKRDRMIQETEMKQRPARMASLLKSFQTVHPTLKQEVSVLKTNSCNGSGGRQ